MCGKLVKSMYGTRDAAQNWEREYCEFMEEERFLTGKASPCVFRHPERKLRVVIHGDDFTVLGFEKDLDWFRTRIEEKFEVKFRGRLGPGKNDDKRIRILNRGIEWSETGIRYEPDRRHAELMIEALGLDQNSNGVVTPTAKIELKESDELLNSTAATMYRAITARGMYLSQDRSDIQYAVKETSRSMSSPKRSDWEKLKRIGRYLLDKKRYVMNYPYQDEVHKLETWVDSDHAGCQTTRKSTSAGVVTFGACTIKTWSSTQGVVALSSGEAELYALVKGGQQSIGIQSILKDLGVDVELQLYTDASAAQGIRKASAKSNI